MTRRAGAVALGLALLALLASCTSAAPSSKALKPSSATSVSAPPLPAAALAGGACLLMDFKVVNAALGSQFDVAGAADKSGTYTCVLQDDSATYPNLTLSITATTLAPADFTASISPSGSKPVSNLGKIGYVVQVKATATVGPAVEVGWLSGNDRLIIMRYTFPTDSAATAATAASDGMTALARTVDATTV
jgi:hypothetical protein